MKATKIAGSDLTVRDAVAAQQQKQGDGRCAEDIHQRRTDGGRRDRAQVGAEQAAGRRAEAGDLPVLHAEGFHDAVAGDGFVQDVLDFGQLVLPAARGAAHPAADFARRINDDGNEQQQHPGQSLCPALRPRPQ